MKKSLITAAVAVLTLASASLVLADAPSFNPIADADFLAGSSVAPTGHYVDAGTFNAVADADFLAGRQDRTFETQRVQDVAWCNAQADADLLAGSRCPVLAAQSKAESARR